MIYKPTVYGRETIEAELSQLIYDVKNCTGLNASAKEKAIGLLAQGYQIIKSNQGKDYLNERG